VRVFGLEGSKPGISAVFLNHRVIRPDVTGHGQIVKQSLINPKLFAPYLLALNEDNPAGINEDVATINAFNKAVYDKFRVPVDEPGSLPVPIKKFLKYFGTKTTFSRDEYGKVFLDTFIERVLGTAMPAESVDCLPAGAVVSPSSASRGLPQRQVPDLAFPFSVHAAGGQENNVLDRRAERQRPAYLEDSRHGFPRSNALVRERGDSGDVVGQ